MHHDRDFKNKIRRRPQENLIAAIETIIHDRDQNKPWQKEEWRNNHRELK